LLEDAAASPVPMALPTMITSIHQIIVIFVILQSRRGDCEVTGRWRSSRQAVTLCQNIVQLLHYSNSFYN